MGSKKAVRRSLWIGTLVAAVAAVAWALWPRPATVDVVAATRGRLEATVGGEGRTQVRDLYVVSAPVDGELERITAQAGDAVAPGAAVARLLPVASRPLDPRSRAEARAAVAQAQAAVTRADASIEQARVGREHAEDALRRAQQLAATGAVSTASLEHAGHEAEDRRRGVEMALATAREARAAVARAVAAASVSGAADGRLAISVASPIAGQVLRILRRSEGPVAAGTPLVEFGDPSRLEVVAELLSSDAATVRPGAAAWIDGWGGERLAAGVRRVEPAAFTKVSALGLEEQRVRVILDLSAPPPPSLGHDYRVDARIVVWEGEDVLRVPATALFRSGLRSGGGWAVFVVRDGRARIAPIEVGASDGEWTVVIQGLAAGDRVIAQPSDAIVDGARVSAPG